MGETPARDVIARALPQAICWCAKLSASCLGGNAHESSVGREEVSSAGRPVRAGEDIEVGDLRRAVQRIGILSKRFAPDGSIKK